MYIWRFPEIGVPQIIHFSGIFHYKPTILGYPRKPPIYIYQPGTRAFPTFGGLASPCSSSRHLKMMTWPKRQATLEKAMNNYGKSLDYGKYANSG